METKIIHPRGRRLVLLCLDWRRRVPGPEDAESGAVEAVVALYDGRLVVEKRDLVHVRAVVRPERRRLRLWVGSRKRLLRDKVRLSVFDKRRSAEGLAGQDGSR